MPIIELKNITKSYSLGDVKTVVLNNISLSVESGEMIAIVGASGSGKSTLMNIIGFLDLADTGEYLFQNKHVKGLSQNDLARLRNRSIGFVFQQFNLLPRLNAYQNVALPLTYRGISPRAIKALVHQVLKRVGMSAFGHHLPQELSGGQQQRIAIARALVTKPEVILADEPTGALDSVTGHEIMQLFAELHHEGSTIIMVTHDEKIANQCERQITIADGVIQADEHVLGHHDINKGRG
tara:strand:- start:797 stop:1510 length:714 start_codon:yes stop_codon:yes gene_type:complete